MHRNSILELIKDYEQRFPNEADVVARLRDFILSHENCFDRTLKSGHLTGSAWLVDLSGKRVLLTDHKKLNGWFQLGGHADNNYDILEVALKEAQEESGIDNIVPVGTNIFDIDIHLIPKYEDIAEHYHYDISFAFQVVDTEEYVVSEESHDLAWVDTTKVSEYSISESMLRLADKWHLLKRGARS